MASKFRDFKKFWNHKFGRHHPKESEARINLQKELFQFNKCAYHGFPFKPTAMAYDPKLKLLAVGTRSGAIRISGTPGVEFSAQHTDDVSVLQLFFLPEQARLITLCSDNTLHLWEVNAREGKSVLEEVNVFNQFVSEGSKLKTISACCLSANGEQLLMGTEGGNIHLLDVKTFDLLEHIIYQDVVMQNVPDDFKVNPGAVEAIAQHPVDDSKFLIGYNRGLIVLWDNKESNADQTYNATQQLESVSWHRDGSQFMSAHADGSYIIWSTADSSKPKEQATTPYGPFPCKAITKIQWKTAKADPFVIFSGGMPRASFGDRHTVSIMQGNDHVVFDFTSKVVDYMVLTKADENTDDDVIPEHDAPHTLVVLAEEELVLIDLETAKWPTFRQPYLCSLHSSAITCAQHVANIPDALWEKIVDAGKSQNNGFSAREWPIGGGTNLAEGTQTKDLLISGHEDGTLRFWDASSLSMSLLYKLTTAHTFTGEFGGADQSTNDAEDEWPPFRRVGTFDPYSDDPKLGIQKIALCPLSETLVVAGTAGQVIVTQMERDERDVEVKAVTVNIVSDRDNFVWKGHDALQVKEGEVKFQAGFQPSVVMQLYPPAACTALAVHSEWQLLAAGTGHGLAMFDYIQKREVMTKCTLNPEDLTGTGESAMSRRKSFKKSLRESFRRLRRRRSGGASDKKPKKEEPKAEEAKPAESPKTETPAEGEAKPETEASAETPAAAEGETPAEPPAEETPKTEEITPAPEPETTPSPVQETGTRSVERQVEARPVDDSMASMVRYLYFADTFLLNPNTHTPTLWAGTNAGTIYVYTVTVPANDKREEEQITCQLAKEIHLKHRAPVLSITAIDKTYTPLPEPLEVQHERAKTPDMTGNHQLVICSEEQFKIFSLPSLKAVGKEKVTAHEGSKIRRVGFCSYRSRSDDQYSENDIACLNNQGELAVYTLPGLRRQLKAECIKKEDINGIGSCIFTKNGQGFFLNSSSEYVRFSLSASKITEPVCMVELKEGMRPAPPEPEPEPVEVPAETAAEETPAAEAETPVAEIETPAAESTEAVAEDDKPKPTVDENVTETVVTETKTTTVSEEGSSTVVVEKSTVITTSETVLETSTTESVSAADITMDSVKDYTETKDEPAVPVATEGGDENVDDDTKAAQSDQTSEVAETTEQLEELKITEEGDAAPDSEPSSPTTPSGESSSKKKKNKKRKSKK